MMDAPNTGPDIPEPPDTDLDSPEDVAAESQNPATSPDAPYHDAVRGSGVNSGPNPDPFHDAVESKRRAEESRESGGAHLPASEAETTAPGDNLR
jgi:hypothetical protein